MKKILVAMALSLSVMSAYAQAVPADVLQQIKQKYAQKYPDNFSMQKTLVEDQVKNYKIMQRWTSEPGVPSQVFNTIKKIYSNKYPDDFSMQNTLVSDQCECYRFVQSYNGNGKVPKRVVDNIKRKYSDKYPFDFSMQKTLILEQVKSYIEMNGSREEEPVQGPQKKSEYGPKDDWGAAGGGWGKGNSR